LLGRQRGEGATHRRALLERTRPRLRITLGRRKAEVIEHVHKRITVVARGSRDTVSLFELTTSQQIDSLVVGHTQEPREEPTAIWLIRSGLAPQLQEGLLDDLLGGRPVGQEPQRKRVDPTTVTLVRELESSGVAASYGGDQRRVVIHGRLGGRVPGQRRMRATSS
jgi:hypothetical protein